MTPSANLRRVARVLEPAECARAVSRFDAALSRAREGPADPDVWSPTSSSLRWHDALALDAPSLATIEARVLDASGCDPCWVIDLELAWWRRQYPSALAPDRHRPHGWHQDGALGFDFAARPGGDREGLRPLLTCWIALTPCGAEAPGLELVDAAVDGVLGLEALDDGALRRRHPPAAFVRPVLDAGDALLFAGGVPHRTHLTPAMTGVRSSLELRFVRRRACAPRSST